MIESMPSILQPILLRDGMKFRALTRYQFTLDDKLWVCRHLVNSVDDIDAELSPAVRVFCAKYSMPVRQVVEWIDIYSDGGDFDAPAASLLDTTGIQHPNPNINTNLNPNRYL
jgi:hypothetical protein